MGGSVSAYFTQYIAAGSQPSVTSERAIGCAPASVEAESAEWLCSVKFLSLCVLNFRRPRRIDVSRVPIPVAPSPPLLLVLASSKVSALEAGADGAHSKSFAFERDPHRVHRQHAIRPHRTQKAGGSIAEDVQVRFWDLTLRPGWRAAQGMARATDAAYRLACARARGPCGTGGRSGWARGLPKDQERSDLDEQLSANRERRDE
jgi:hypothetical protein